jgi:zinc protease
MARQVERIIALQGLDARGAAAARFRELAYPQRHPYARQPHGLATTVRCIRADALEQFHRTCMQPNRTIVSVAGDFCFAELLEHTVRLFGAWTGSDPLSDAPSIPPRPPRPAPAREHVSLASNGQTELIVGGPALGRSEPGYRALQLGTLILGQLGLNGRLGARLREQEGLAYECYAALEDVPVAALWTARASVRSADLGSATSAILDELRRLRMDPVTAQELASSQTACLGRFALALETNASLAGVLQSIAAGGSALDNVDLTAFVDEVRQVTVEDIQAAAQAWLDEEHLLLVSAGP